MFGLKTARAGGRWVWRGLKEAWEVSRWAKLQMLTEVDNILFHQLWQDQLTGEGEDTGVQKAHSWNGPGESERGPGADRKAAGQNPQRGPRRRSMAVQRPLLSPRPRARLRGRMDSCLRMGSHQPSALTVSVTVRVNKPCRCNGQSSLASWGRSAAATFSLSSQASQAQWENLARESCPLDYAATSIPLPPSVPMASFLAGQRLSVTTIGLQGFS